MTSIDKLLEVMKALRHPDTGCPWDIEQDFATIAPYTIEEAYEVADAIARADILPGLRDELGDLLFQVVFHAQMADEAGQFDFEDVAAAISAKMIRRHPHVFGDAAERAAGKRDGSWERIKAEERAASDDTSNDSSVLAGVAHALPALKRSQKLGKRAAGAGFDWPDRRGARAKIQEELDELDAAVDSGVSGDVAEELGDLLFSVVNLARHLGVDPETALTAANRKFERRFRGMESAIHDSGRRLDDCSLEVLESEWQKAKRRRN